MVKLSAWLAIAVGVVLAAAQLIRNYDNLANWPSWAVDEFAAGVLVAAGLLALRKRTTRLLPVGWSFACGLYASALIGHLHAFYGAGDEWRLAEQKLVMIIGALLATSLVGLALVLFGRRST